MASAGPVAGVDYPVVNGFLTPGQQPFPPLKTSYFGNLYYVKQTTDSDYNAFFEQRYQIYPDGSASIYNTIAAAKAAVVSNRDDVIMLGPGNWNENVVFTQNGFHIFGAGCGNTYIKPSAATTKIAVTPLGETQCLATGLIITGRAVEIANLSIQASNTTDLGIYIGDGGRVNVLPALAVGNPHSAWVHHVHFDGNGVMEWGMCLDGMGPGTVIEDNVFFNASGGGIVYCSGLNKDQVGAVMRKNAFLGMGTIGVKRAANSVAYGNVITQNNFADMNASHVPTEAVSLGAAGGPDTIQGNWFGLTNTFTATATDFQSGNYKTVAGNTVNFVSQS